ncbi:MAG: hypothetical protein EOP04_12260, partial [Proteobacteria bacterium]
MVFSNAHCCEVVLFLFALSKFPRDRDAPEKRGFGMSIQERRDRSGEVYYSYSYTDPVSKARVRLSKDQTPKFKNREEADAWGKTQDAHVSAMKHAAQQREAWKSAFHNWVQLQDKFAEYKKKKAPRSYKRVISSIEKYVLPFFLGEKNLNNANTWYMYFGEYKEWLAIQIQEHSEKPLAFSTQNHCFNALNSFLDYLAEFNHISPDSNRKCKLYEGHLLGARTVEDIYSPQELIEVEANLRKIDESVADFFHVLSVTGMRFNELFSLPMSALFPGHMTNAIHAELTEKKIEYVGYIVLESQLAKDEKTDVVNKKRDSTGKHERWPFKGRKEISPKHFRFIPVQTKKTYNILASRYKAQKELLDRKVHGDSKTNYLLFDEIEVNRARKALSKACEAIGISKDFHSLRHSFSTHLVGSTRSFYLAKTLLGHKTEKEFDRYCHSQIFKRYTRHARLRIIYRRRKGRSIHHFRYACYEISKSPWEMVGRFARYRG